MIIFKTVKWKNFLSTGNNFTEIQLDKDSTTLIIGENGAGKSTILDALCFGLFGKAFRSINKMQLVNTVNGSSALVEVEFSIGSKKLKVIRGIKPNIFEIYIDGKMYNQDANAKDYQKYLEQQILKLNYRSFTQVVILGSSTFVPFMQLKARHRRDVVEEILDIQIFSLMNMIVKQKLKTIDEEYKEIDHKYRLVEQEVILKEKYVEDIKENKRKLLAEKRNLISGNEEEVFKKKAKIKDFENDVESMHKKIENSTNIEDRYNKLKDIRSQLKEKHRTHTRFISFFEKNEDCPTCQQHIDETFKKGMIDTENSKSEKLTSGMEELLEELKSAESKIITIKEVNKNIIL